MKYELKPAYSEWPVSMLVISSMSKVRFLSFRRVEISIRLSVSPLPAFTKT